MRYRIRTIDKYQHYHHRKPPWLKLHREILDDPDYACLHDSSWRLGLELILLATESEDGAFDGDVSALSWRLRRKVSPRDVQALVDARFIVPASTVLAPCEHNASNMLLQSRVETETETDIPSDASASDSPPSAADGSPGDPTIPDREIRSLHAYYLQRRGIPEAQCQLTRARREKYRLRLREFDASVLRAVIDVACGSDFHAGKNDSGNVYLDPARHLFKSREKVEWWIEKGGIRVA